MGLDGKSGGVLFSVNTTYYEMSSDLTLRTTDLHRDVFITRIQRDVTPSTQQVDVTSNTQLSSRPYASNMPYADIDEQ